MPLSKQAHVVSMQALSLSHQESLLNPCFTGVVRQDASYP